MMYSIVVAVYNRPQELGELLESLTHQTFKDFEVVVVEDGSTITSKALCAEYSSKLKISYFAKQNSGPGLSRNYGCRRATGDYFIFLDSDCTVPQDYLENANAGRIRHSLDAFGGPDREHESFTNVQKAISYSMTSFLTTGGIRGSKKSVTGKFLPRSFNMGLSRTVFNETDGFSSMRFGEDIDLSMRIIEEGFKVGLIPEAWVYHKRRTDFKKFFKQVYNSGIARVNLTIRHPGSLKLFHLFPTAFSLYVVVSLVYAFVLPFGFFLLVPIAVFKLAVFATSTIQNHSVVVGFLSIIAAFVQLTGYGFGLLAGLFSRTILNKKDGGAFEKTFYK